MQTLERKEAWTVIDCEDDMNIIGSTWVLKLKRYPDKLIKFKAHVWIVLKHVHLLSSRPMFV